MRKYICFLILSAFATISMATPVTIIKPNFGTIVVTDNQGKIYEPDSTYEFTQGTLLNLSHSPKNECSYFAEWHCVGADVIDNQLTVGNEPITLRARFQIIQYTIEAEVVPNNVGTVSIKCGIGSLFLDVAGKVNCSSPIQLIVNEDQETGYHFIKWNDGNTEKKRLVSADSDKTYIAYFASEDSINDLDEIEQNNNSFKYIDNGFLFINHNGNLYDAQGQKIK